MIRVRLKPIVFFVSAGLLGVATHASASGFQIFETDAAGFSNYHAGYAAAADTASTDFYNPAGMTRIHNQQLVIGAAGVMPSFKFKGTVDTSLMGQNFHYNTTAQGGKFNLIPNLHYVAPINDRMNFGLSFTIPFGLKSDYGGQTDLRYSATLSSVMVFDLSPALAYRVTDKLSLGGGFDIQRMFMDFNNVVGANNPNFDTISTNKFNDTGYGYHLGALYEFTPTSRVGMSYHSAVSHHLTGKSTFYGPLSFQQMPIVSTNAWINMRLPAYTAVSFYHRPVEKLAVMGSVIYTQWNSIQSLAFHNLAAIDNTLEPTKNLNVSIPQNYRNTYNFSLGVDYDITDTVQLRTGVGYDQSPVRSAYRTVQMPDNNRYVVSLGTHLKVSQNVAVDLGWTHLFIKDTKVSHAVQDRGLYHVETNGVVSGGADVLAGQITWDMF